MFIGEYDINNRFDILMIFNWIISDSNHIEMEKLIMFFEKNPKERDFFVSLLKSHREKNPEWVDEILVEIEMYIRNDENFLGLAGFDFTSTNIFVIDELPNRFDGTDTYVREMLNMFGFDFSTDSMSLYFFNGKNGLLARDELTLHSFAYAQLIKEGYSGDIPDTDFVIGRIGTSILLILKDNNVYGFNIYSDYNDKNLVFICKKENVKSDLYKASHLSLSLVLLK